MEKNDFDNVSTHSVSSFSTSFDSQAPSSSREKLQISYGDLLGRHGKIVDATTKQLVYTSEHRYRKPTFALNSPTGDREIATASSGTLTMKFDVNIAGNNFELTPRRKLGSSVTYPSPAYNGQTLAWDRHGSWSGRITYTCTDGRGLPIARIQSGSAWKCVSWGKFGEIEFMDGKIENEAQRDEIVATGLCLLYRSYMNSQSGANAVVVTS